MIDLVEIMIFELKGFIECSYEDDEELLTKYHIDTFTFEEAVDETMSMIAIAGIGINMRYFGVIKDVEKIGYLCVFENNLYSFAINIEYRTKDVLSDFWDAIIDILGTSFITMLYPNNTRAINWLKKCGMVTVEGVEDNCVTLLNVTKRDTETIFSKN